MNCQRQIEADHVCIGHWAEDWKTHSEAVANCCINRRGVAYALVNQSEGLSPQSMLQAIRNESRNIFLDTNGFLANAPKQIEDGVHVIRRSMFSSDHFHQGNQKRWLIEVRT